MEQTRSRLQHLLDHLPRPRVASAGMPYIRRQVLRGQRAAATATHALWVPSENIWGFVVVAVVALVLSFIVALIEVWRKD
jgi:hypothetical protein